MRKQNRRVLVVFSDTHAGHKLGLLNPETRDVVEAVTDGGYSELKEIPHQLTPVQEWLWGVYEKNIRLTMELAGRDPVTLVHNGDLTQGVKYLEGINGDIRSQFAIATSNMRPWFKYKNIKEFRIVWGTASHELGSGTVPLIVADILRLDFPKVNIQTVKHLLLKIGGVWCDIAHHGPAGGVRNWLRGNTARYYTRSMMLDSATNGERPPDVVVRSHYHTRIEEYLVQWYKQWGRVRTAFLLTPSYQGMNEYARQITQSANKVINGHVAIEIINGVVHDVHWFCDERDMRSIERL